MTAAHYADFSAKDRADLQRIAWEGLEQFREIAAAQ